MNKFKYIFLVIGLVFFLFLVKEIGFANISKTFSLLGFNFVTILLLYFVNYTFQNFAWAVEMRKTFREVGFLRLYKARIAGEALNALVPLGNFGGEPVKAYLLDDRASRTEIIASLVLDKTIFSFAALLYIFSGLIVAIALLGAFSFKEKLVIFLLLFLMVWGLIVFVRKKDFFAALLGWVGKLGIATAYIARRMDSIVRMDERIASFYRANKKRFMISLLLHYVAKLTQGLEFYLLFIYLGMDLTFAHALCISSLSIIINAIFFFIPGHWGIAEGAQGFIFMALGMNISDGITVGIVRRARHVFWIIMGLIVFGFSNPKQKKEVMEDMEGTM